MIWKDTRSLMFIAAMLTIAKVWEQPKCPLTAEWINMNKYEIWSISMKEVRHKDMYYKAYMWNLEKPN